MSLRSSRHSRWGRRTRQDRRSVAPEDAAQAAVAGDAPCDGSATVQVQPAGEDEYSQAMDRSFRLLAVRARSVEELRARLELAGFGPSVVVRVIERLLELEYLDDDSFARTWVAERTSGTKASGRHRIAWELADKGIARTTIESALAAYSADAEGVAAVRIAEVIAARSEGERPERLRNRIYQTLARRGFDREAIDRAISETVRRGQSE